MIAQNHLGRLLAGILTAALLFAYSGVRAQTRQEHVHRMSHEVMPFSMSRTIHLFRMTESGGIQQVLVRNPDAADEIPRIRRHLKHEAERFAAGDYSDPAALHGTEMPGLAELTANPSRVTVTYSELPGGAQLTFETKDLDMLTAIHRWFGAQLSEHGADARAQ